MGLFRLLCSVLFDLVIRSNLRADIEVVALQLLPRLQGSEIL